ncbi:MAG: C4-type zinc ribbon domain-containing protein [Acidobacteriota bacterium]
MSQYLETIIELQGAMNQLREAETRLNSIPDWMRELHDEHSGTKSEIDAIQETVDAAARERRAAEAAASDAQEKLKKYQQQINRVSTQREYGALLQEIDTVKTLISGSEEQALSSLDRHEKAEKQLEERKESFQELDRRYAAELERWESEKPGVARQVADLKTRIADLRSKLPRLAVSQFDRILERHPNSALSAIRLIERPGGKGQKEWACTSCNYRIRPQSVVEIRNGNSLVQCDSCKRILYLEAEPA